MFFMSMCLVPLLMLATSGSKIDADDMDAFGSARYSTGNVGFLRVDACEYVGVNCPLPSARPSLTPSPPCAL